MEGLAGSYQQAANGTQDAYMAAQWTEATPPEAGPSNPTRPTAGVYGPAQAPGQEQIPAVDATAPDPWLAALVQQLESMGFNRGINLGDITHSIQANARAINEVAHRQEPPTAITPAARAADPKIRAPFTFDGTRDDDLVDEWVTTMREYISFYRRQGSILTEEDAVTIASSYLHREIKKFWTTRKALDDQSQVPITLETMFSTIRHACEEVNGQERTRAKYNSLRQTKGVREYAYALLALAKKLVPPPPESEVLEKFKTGLQGHVRIRLAEQFNTPTVLGDYMDFCDRIDRNWYENRHIYRDSHRSTPAYNTMATPLNSIASSSHGSRPDINGPQWSDWCKENRACFGCGSRDHTVSTCPNPRGRSHAGPSTYRRDPERSRSRSTTRRHPTTPFRRGANAGPGRGGRYRSPGRLLGQRRVSFTAPTAKDRA